MPFHTNTARQQEKLQFIHLSLRFWTSGRISPYKGLSGIDWKGLPKKVPKTEQFSCSSKETPGETQGWNSNKNENYTSNCQENFPRDSTVNE